MATALPFDLVSFCEKLSAAVTTAGRQYGWRVQAFGKSGFNTDVIVGQVILKILTSGQPAADGSGAVVRFSRSGHDKAFAVRRGPSGDLELTDAADGSVVSLERFVELVGVACDQPIRTTSALPTALERLCEQLGAAVVSTGQDNGWRVQQFGQRGFNADITVGRTLVKATTEGSPNADGSGAIIRLKREGFETAFGTKVGANGSLVACDPQGRPVDLEGFVGTVAEVGGVPLSTEVPVTQTYVRLCERLSALVVKAGQDNGWKVRLFGKRGFNADAQVGHDIVKITSELAATSDGGDAVLWVRRPGFERRFTHRLGKDSELELVDDSGVLCRPDKFIKIVAEACRTPLKEEIQVPEALATFYEIIMSTVSNAGMDNGWNVQQFGKSGVNADVQVGGTIVKVTSSGRASADGGGATVKIARPGFERSFTTRAQPSGQVELTENGAPISLGRFIQVLAEACSARLKEVAELPHTFRRFCERLASAVSTAGNANGWRVTQFGKGFNADLAVGSNIVKVTTEGKVAPDGTGTVVRVKRPGHDSVFRSQLGGDAELELTDEAGTTVTFTRFIDLLKEVSRF